MKIEKHLAGSGLTPLEESVIHRISADSWFELVRELVPAGQPAGDPTKWTMTGGNPYNPTSNGDRLYARGTSDTHGNLACTLVAVKAIAIGIKGDFEITAEPSGWTKPTGSYGQEVVWGIY